MGENFFVFFSVELLRPLVSVNKDFLKFAISEVLLKNLLPYAYALGPGLYAYAGHTRQELMRMLSIRIHFSNGRLL